ncbi:MAG: TniB family NTP-binding protein [Chlorobia bacterium]|nr:TniB family NTP-binding protein [Fimbriimonadaceae bacterium]
MPRKNESAFVFRSLKLARGLSLAFGRAAKRGSIAFCIAASGMGKTTLAEHIARIIFGPKEGWEPGKMPVLLVGADNPDRGFFLSKSLTKDLLTEVHDPFRSSIAEILNWDIDEDLKCRLVAAVSDIGVLDSSETDMREAFINLAKLLEVKYIIVDEANLLVLTQRTRSPTDYVESLRRLGDKIGCAILLLGTVDMLELLGYSGQVNRRKLRIHLDRIRCDDQAGRDEFIDFLRSIEEDFDLPRGILESKASEIYQATYGIPGELVCWIERAELQQIATESEIASWEHFEAQCLLPVEQERMRWEADLIERVMHGHVLTEKDKKEIEKRRKNRMKARRIAAGEPA